MAIGKNQAKMNKRALEKIVDSFPDPIFVTDKDGNVLLSNSTTAMTLDMSLDQLLKSNLNDIVKLGYYNESYAVQAGRKKCVVKGIIQTKINFTMMSTSTPILNETGEVIAVITVGKSLRELEKSSTPEEREKVFQYKREIEYLRSRVLETDEIVAESPAMRQVLLKAHRLAQTDSTIVLQGESGTGKEVLAKYIHRHSKRSNESFIAINCAALPDTLAESELFGYEKGAFTGASTDGKLGLFEAAKGGTLFLDEVAELSLPMQAKLLRVLETGELRRLGSTSYHKVDVRLIAASHRDLAALVEERLFREDLYYRLNVFTLEIAPLRERPEDIIALSAKFLDGFNQKYHLEVELKQETLSSLLTYQWPGNVRELRNEIERIVVSDLHDFSDERITLATRSYEVAKIDIFKLMGLNGPLKDVMKQIEEQYIHYVLASCDGKIGKTADKLGIYRTVLYRKLKELRQDKAE